MGGEFFTLQRCNGVVGRNGQGVPVRFRRRRKCPRQGTVHRAFTRVRRWAGDQPADALSSPPPRVLVDRTRWLDPPIRPARPSQSPTHFKKCSARSDRDARSTELVSAPAPEEAAATEQ